MSYLLVDEDGEEEGKGEGLRAGDLGYGAGLPPCALPARSWLRAAPRASEPIKHPKLAPAPEGHALSLGSPARATSAAVKSKLSIATCYFMSIQDTCARGRPLGLWREQPPQRARAQPSSGERCLRSQEPFATAKTAHPKVNRVPLLHSPAHDSSSSRASRVLPSCMTREVYFLYASGPCTFPCPQGLHARLFSSSQAALSAAKRGRRGKELNFRPAGRRDRTPQHKVPQWQKTGPRATSNARARDGALMDISGTDNQPYFVHSSSRRSHPVGSLR